jgi:1-acyl-sn-glycerol-3-phosphate acyltransferase
VGSELELFVMRMHTGRRPSTDDALHEAHDKEVAERIERLHDALALHRDKQLSLAHVIRFLAGIIYWFGVACPFLYLCLPLRWCHPLLRKLGMRNNFLPMDIALNYVSRAFMLLCNVKVEAEAAHNMDVTRPTISMYNHGSNLDPLAIASESPIHYKWIGKKQLFLIPILGWLFSGLGMIALDRANREKAIKTLDTAVAQVQRWGRSVCIAPEGTRSTSGQLLPFKKGPFYMAEALKLPISPVVIFGAFNLWPPGQIFPSPGTITIRFLPWIAVTDGTSRHDMEDLVREAFLRELAIAPKAPPCLASSLLAPARTGFAGDSGLLAQVAYTKPPPQLHTIASTVMVAERASPSRAPPDAKLKRVTA